MAPRSANRGCPEGGGAVGILILSNCALVIFIVKKVDGTSNSSCVAESNKNILA